MSGSADVHLTETDLDMKLAWIVAEMATEAPEGIIDLKKANEALVLSNMYRGDEAAYPRLAVREIVQNFFWLAVSKHGAT